MVRDRIDWTGENAVSVEAQVFIYVLRGNLKLKCNHSLLIFTLDPKVLEVIT